MMLLLAPLDGELIGHHVQQSLGQKDFTRPELVAAQAISVGDLSLLGVWGYVALVPGINGDYELLRHKYEIRIIEGTSDVVDDFSKSAEKYATTYNRYVFNRLGCDIERPMERCKNYP